MTRSGYPDLSRRTNRVQAEGLTAEEHDVFAPVIKKSSRKVRCYPFESFHTAMIFWRAELSRGRTITGNQTASTELGPPPVVTAATLGFKGFSAGPGPAEQDGGSLRTASGILGGLRLDGGWEDAGFKALLADSKNSAPL